MPLVPPGAGKAARTRRPGSQETCPRRSSTARAGCTARSGLVGPPEAAWRDPVVTMTDVVAKGEKPELRLLFVSAALLAAPCLAQSTPSPGPDTLTVVATRVAVPVAQVGQSVTVIDAATIAQRQRDTVADLLLQTPGVALTRNGGLGQTTTIRIRGAESAQTAVLIDGVKVNDPSAPSGEFDFASLLTGTIARIEVLRGPQSVLWGSSAIGGVVLVETAEPGTVTAGNARAEYGARQTGSVAANLSSARGPVRLGIGGQYLSTGGISAASEARGNGERDGARIAGGTARLSADATDWLTLDARLFYTRARVEFDGFPPPVFTLADTRDYGITRQLVGYLGARATALDGQLVNRVGYAETRIDRTTFARDPARVTTFDGSGINRRLDWQSTLSLGRVRLVAGAEREVQTLRTLPFGSTGRDRARLFGVYAQGVVPLGRGLTAIVGLRHDDHSRFGGATTGGASLAWALPTRTTLRASYAEGFKAPTLFQLGGDFGNAALRAERAQSWDAGVEQGLPGGRGSIGVTAFERRSTDLIDFVSCFRAASAICANRPFGTYDNVARAAVHGIEAEASLRPFEELRIDAAYTLLDARNRSAGAPNFDRRLARRPRHTVSISADWAASAAGPSLGATLTRVGASFDDAANVRRLAGYTLVDLRASMPLQRGLELQARVENLLDRVYETASGYGQPRRQAFVGLRGRF